MNKINSAGVKLLKYLRGENVGGAVNKIKGSIFAIILGILIAMIPMLLELATRQGVRISEALRGLFIVPFKKISIKNTFVFISIFILVGGGIGVSFKTGLFNIGASGQMMLAGGVSIIVGIMHPAPSIPRPIWVMMLMVISMLLGAFLAGIAGFLKAFANVHEVISTIMLNWIVFYFLKWIFTFEALKGTISTSKPIHKGYSLILGNSSHVAIIFSLAIGLMILLTFIFKYTKLGYSMKMNGLNTNAAKYSGINNKLTTIYSMLFSGALAGLGGYIYYTTANTVMPEFQGLNLIGFESITVTLLSFSSPIGAIAAGFFYGTFYTGSDFAYALACMSKETFKLVVGIIIFTASIAPILTNVKPYIGFRNLMISTSDDEIIKRTRQMRHEVKLKKSEFKKTKAEYFEQQRKAKLEFITRKTTSNDLFKLAKEINYHKYIKSNLIVVYKNELSKLNNLLKQQSNSASLTNISIKKRELLNNLVFESEKLDVNYYKNVLNSHKSKIKSIKNEFKLWRNQRIEKIVKDFWNKAYIRISAKSHPDVIKLKKQRQEKLASVSAAKEKLNAASSEKEKKSILKQEKIRIKKEKKSIKAEYKNLIIQKKLELRNLNTINNKTINVEGGE